MSLYFTLNEQKEVIPTDNVHVWAGTWRRVEGSHFRLRQYRPPRKGGYRKSAKTISVYVSTVFLGLDHNYNDSGLPIVFETMVFYQRKKYCTPFELFQERYSTWKEAEKGHKDICKMVWNYHNAR